MSWVSWPPSCTPCTSCLLLPLAVSPRLDLRLAIPLSELCRYPSLWLRSQICSTHHRGHRLLLNHSSGRISLLYINKQMQYKEGQTDWQAVRSSAEAEPRSYSFISSNPYSNCRCCGPGVPSWHFLVAGPYIVTCLLCFPGLLSERRSSQDQGSSSRNLDYSRSEKTWQIETIGGEFHPRLQILKCKENVTQKTWSLIVLHSGFLQSWGLVRHFCQKKKKN